MKKILCTFISMLMIISLIGGCAPSSDTTENPETAQTDNTDTKEPAPESTKEEFNWMDWAIKPEDKVEDVTARIKKASETSDYAYDDMSKHYTITMYGGAWQPEPMPEDNAVMKYFEEKLNITLKVKAYVSVDELAQQVALAFASNSQPDMVYTTKPDIMQKLAKQDMILDWTPYLKYIPTTIAQIKQSEMQTRFIDGKFVGIPYLNGNDANVWQSWIRKDWLDKLGIAEPKTADELFAAAVRFTKEDPDGNGLDDTWGFTGCGEGKTFGWIDGNINNFFSIPSVGYVNGAALPRAINPAFRDGLRYIKRAVDEKVIDPDWYTQDWLKCYNKIRAGNIGIIYMWMPGAMTVVEGGAGAGSGKEPNKRANGEEWKFDDWKLLETEGYRGQGGWDNSGGYFMISKKNMEAEPGKIERLMHYIDAMTAPHEMGVDMGLAAKPAGGVIEEIGLGKKLNWEGIEPKMLTNYRYYGWANWKYIQPMLKLLPWYAGVDPTFQQKVLDLQVYCNDNIKDTEEYSSLITPNTELATIQSDLLKFTDQAQIDFVLGRRSLDEWDKYVDEYLKKYQGQKVIDNMTTQIKATGLVN